MRRYASPTPMGYSDFNLCVGVRLDDGPLYVCELQVNHVKMLKLVPTGALQGLQQEQRERKQQERSGL